MEGIITMFKEIDLKRLVEQSLLTIINLMICNFDG